MLMSNVFDLLKRSRQSGQSILIVALSIPIFMFLLAIVFDVGMYFVQASRLQNAADSAALAGVGVYTNNFTTKLISKPSDMEFDESFETKLEGTDCAFEPQPNKDDADNRASNYVQANSSVSLDTDETGLWYSPIVVELVDHSTASYTGIYCYRVDLKEPVPLNFGQYFGFDSFDVTASAVAVAIPTADTQPDEDDIDEFIKVVNASIYKTAPNLYWESIYNSSSSHKYNVTSTDAETGAVTTEAGEVYGHANDRYFTTTITDYTSDSELTVAAGMDDDTLAWKWDEGDDPFCAEPIHGNDQLGLKTLVYTINQKFVQGKTSTKKEASSIYIDRPNTQSGGLGTPYRACTINITGETLSGDEDTPLYMRVESEPILVNSQAMLVQPLTINIQAYQKKPMIVAYDGPDPNRGEADTPAVDINTGMVYKLSGSNWVETWRSSGLYDQFTYSFPKQNRPSNLKDTSSTVSAPITVNLKHDLRGVIYAPYSKVIVYGPGAIDGFIMAAEIEDYGTSGTRKTHKTFSSIPNWKASYDNGATNWFKYEVFRVSAEYNVIYDSFHNYTWTDLGAGV